MRADRATKLAQTEAYARSRDDRKKVEIVFAHLKRIIGLRRFRLTFKVLSGHRMGQSTGRKGEPRLAQRFRW